MSAGHQGKLALTTQANFIPSRVFLWQLNMKGCESISIMAFSQTHALSKIVSSWAASFAAKNVNAFLCSLHWLETEY